MAKSPNANHVRLWCRRARRNPHPRQLSSASNAVQTLIRGQPLAFCATLPNLRHSMLEYMSPSHLFVAGLRYFIEQLRLFQRFTDPVRQRHRMDSVNTTDRVAAISKTRMVMISR